MTVQGKNASNEIINQIIKCNHDNEVDVIMLIRGGGSLEDLMPFNEEKMAISIFESKIPIVTGIGHQPDITIADYAADKAMETPTAAAVYIAPDQNEILQNIDILNDSMNMQINNFFENKKNKINILRSKLERINPSTVIKINKNLYSFSWFFEMSGNIPSGQIKIVFSFFCGELILMRSLITEIGSVSL